MGRRGLALAAAVATLAIFASGCGGDADSASSPRVIDAGQVDIKLPPGFKVVNNTVVAPKRTASAASTPTTVAQDPRTAAAGVTTTTSKDSVPLANDSDPTSDMMTAMGKFRTCLDDLGVKFIGAPDGANPDSPTNDPNYIDSLSTCAARSNIVQAMQSAAAAEENLTPAEIKERNEGYLDWRKCMINRGWKIGQPTPDSQGRLFSFSGGSGPDMTPPNGQSIIGSSDIEECATKTQDKFERKQKSGG